jgi:hypothetical protein
MKRFYSIVFAFTLLLGFVTQVSAQFTTNWQKSSATSNLPTWFGADTERGLAYGKVNNNERLYVVSRKVGVKVFVLDAISGDDVTELDVTGVTGGFWVLNDVEVSDDGIIFGANMTLNASTSAFKVYKWDNEASAPTVVVNSILTEAVRLGDKITVVGSVANNTAQIWAASSTSGAATSRVYIWTMTDGAFNATPTIITLSDNVTGASAAVFPRPDGSFYLNYNGETMKRYSSTGTYIGKVDGTLIASGTNALRLLSSRDGFDYVATFAYGAGNHLARVARTPSTPIVSSGTLTGTTLHSSTVSNGSTANANGTGDIDFRLNSDGTITVYVLGTNNGISSSTSTFQFTEVTYSATLTGSTGFRTLASPVANTALSSLLSGLWTQGFTGASTTSGTSNVYFHPNGTNTFVSATNISNTISAGHGVLVAVYEDNDPSTAGVQGGFPKTLSVTGVANSGDVAVTPTHTSGDEYFLAGNPYNSTIDWDLVTKGSDVYSIAWVLKNDGEFDSWNGSVGDLTDGLIAPFQGFFYAYSGELSSVTFTEASKSTGGTFRGKDANPVAFRLVLGREGRENSTWLQFAEDGTFGRDAKDAPKMTSLSSDVMQIATKELETGASMDIHYLPMITETLDLPLNIVANSGGAFSLSVEASTLPEGWSVMVRDAVSGRVYNLTTERFEFESDVITSAQSRFTLIVEPNTSTSIETATELPDGIALEQNYPNPFNPTTRISYTMPVSGTAHLAVYDLLGREVAVLVNGPVAAGSQFVNFDASALSSGVYMYRLTAGGQTLTRKMTLMK